MYAHMSMHITIGSKRHRAVQTVKWPFAWKQTTCNYDKLANLNNDNANDDNHRYGTIIDRLTGVHEHMTIQTAQWTQHFATNPTFIYV